MNELTLTYIEFAGVLYVSIVVGIVIGNLLSPDRRRAEIELP